MRRALPPPDGVRSDLEMLADLADRLGRGKYFSAEPREVFEELRRASAGGLADYSGISYDRIYMSFERHMKCGTGKCGHCQIGHQYVCLDGPVFNYWEAKNIQGSM